MVGQRIGFPKFKYRNVDIREHLPTNMNEAFHYEIKCIDCTRVIGKSPKDLGDLAIFCFPCEHDFLNLQS